jgi:hypothetical protein
MAHERSERARVSWPPRGLHRDSQPEKTVQDKR